MARLGAGWGGPDSSSSGPGAGPRPARPERLSHPPVVPRQGIYSPILQMKKPKLLSPREPCPGPSAVSGSGGTTLGASQGCAGWAGEGEGRRGARAPETTAPGCCRGWGKGLLAGGGGGRGTRTGRGLRKEVWGVLVSSRPTQWATRCSCQDTRASPIPPGCQGAASGPWPQAQAPGTPGKGLPESGGPPHCGHLILSTHTCPSRCQCQTLAGSRQGDGLPVSH